MADESDSIISIFE